MATVKLTIPNAHISRVLDAMSGIYGYQETIDDGGGSMIPNPESTADFAKRMIASFVVNLLKSIVVSPFFNKIF